MDSARWAGVTVFMGQRYASARYRVKHAYNPLLAPESASPNWKGLGLPRLSDAVDPAAAYVTGSRKPMPIDQDSSQEQMPWI
jgi:hypothetical protein